MNFYITLPSGPSADEPDQQSTWAEIFLEKPIELGCQYEVALVQSVFDDVFKASLAKISIFPPDSNMDMFLFELLANDGEEISTIIKNLNHRIKTTFSGPGPIPNVLVNEATLEFMVHQPEGWQIIITDVDNNHIVSTSENTQFKFKNRKFYHLRHFYVFSDLVQDQNYKKSGLLNDICLNEIKSNVVGYNPVIPRYIKLKEKNINNFYIEYSTKFNSHTILPGKITSTLHFRKINGF